MRATFAQPPWWVYSTAFVMSFNGGYINSVTLVSILHSTVGYVTGNLTLAGDAFQQGHFPLFSHLITLVLCFLFGSIISGMLIKSEHYALDRRYSASLALQFMFVLVAMILLLHDDTLASYLLAGAMGMQNAMTTHYGSALIRTTHMTGTTTDLGLLISRWIKGHAVEPWKALLYSVLIGGFLIGAMSGTLCYAFIQAWALFLPLLIYAAMLYLQQQRQCIKH